MRKTILMFCLCSGCAATQIGDLYVEHARCVNTSAVGCDVIWAEIERREMTIARYEAEIHCRKGLVDIDDDWGHQACISDSEARRLFAGL